MTKGFKLIGHRGAAGYAPENTMPSFQKAVDLGAKWVEFDVRMSVDQKPMVIHDKDLSRVLDRPHRVEMTSSSMLNGFGVLSLEDALGFLEDKGVGAYVEIKSCPSEHLDVIVECVKKGVCPRIISSFDHALLMQIRTNHPTIMLQPLFDQIPFFRPSVLDLIAPVEIGVSASRLSFPGGSRILKWGYPVCAYTVNDPARAIKFRKMGLAGVFSDYPDLLPITDQG